MIRIILLLHAGQWYDKNYLWFCQPVIPSLILLYEEMDVEGTILDTA